jgi:hypothetical protein
MNEGFGNMMCAEAALFAGIANNTTVETGNNSERKYAETRKDVQ